MSRILCSGQRNLVVPWPDALVPLGPFTPVSAAPAPPPLSIHYLQGPVPWVDLQKVGMTGQPIRLGLGKTMPIPFDGVGWEVRPAFDILSLSINRPAGTPPAVLVQHDCVLLLDVDMDFKSAGLLTLDQIVTVDFGDANVQILRIPIHGMELVEYQIESSPTWPGTLLATLQGDASSKNAAGAIRWNLTPTFVGAPNLTGANQRQRAILGRVNLVSTATYDLSMTVVERDFIGLFVNGGGTAGADTFDLQMRGFLRR